MCHSIRKYKKIGCFINKKTISFLVKHWSSEKAKQWAVGKSTAHINMLEISLLSSNVHIAHALKFPSKCTKYVFVCFLFIGAQRSAIMLFYAFDLENCKANDKIAIRQRKIWGQFTSITNVVLSRFFFYRSLSLLQSRM